MSWQAENMDIALDTEMPSVAVPVEKSRVMRHSYYLNFCTPSYTMAWWGWPQWERHIDWMALHGINEPLIITGREYVMWKLFQEVGLKDLVIREYFTGPAFLAWHRMGNLQSFGGPLPKAWLTSQFELTKKIL